MFPCVFCLHLVALASGLCMLCDGDTRDPSYTLSLAEFPKFQKTKRMHFLSQHGNTYRGMDLIYLNTYMPCSAFIGIHSFWNYTTISCQTNCLQHHFHHRPDWNSSRLCEQTDFAGHCPCQDQIKNRFIWPEIPVEITKTKIIGVCESTTVARVIDFALILHQASVAG